MLLLKNAFVYSPLYLQQVDILICNSTIEKIGDNIKVPSNLNIEIIDVSGKIITPGFIDNHVHLIGGGGEAGFATRVPELMLSDFTKNGITTVIGLLGTDGITRSPKDLLAKVKALNTEGITAYMHTSSYSYPPVLVTNSVADDITFINEIIGVKIALSDHRSSFVTKEELLRVASQARVAGMLSNKAGIVLAHMGDEKTELSMVKEILKETSLPSKTIIPTHCNRNSYLLKSSFEYAKMGGFIDLTSFDEENLSVLNAIKEAKQQNVPLSNITISSDGNGSTSTYDKEGNLLSIGVLQIDRVLNEFQTLVKKGKFSIEEALQFVTTNPAKAFALSNKGQIKEGFDADLLIFDDKLNLESTIAKGRFMMRNKKIIVKGTYE